MRIKRIVSEDQARNLREQAELRRMGEEWAERWRGCFDTSRMDREEGEWAARGEESQDPADYPGAAHD